MSHDTQFEYEAPALRRLGSIQELTGQQFNKVGTASDFLSTLNNQVVGSLTGLP
jgi:hypothetical protein